VILGAVGINVGLGSDGAVQGEGIRDSGAGLVLDAAVAGSSSDAGGVAADSKDQIDENKYSPKGAIQLTV